jgi:hypothetical protein
MGSSYENEKLVAVLSAELPALLAGRLELELEPIKIHMAQPNLRVEAGVRVRMRCAKGLADPGW